MTLITAVKCPTGIVVGWDSSVTTDTGEKLHCHCAKVRHLMSGPKKGSLHLGSLEEVSVKPLSLGCAGDLTSCQRILSFWYPQIPIDLDITNHQVLLDHMLRNEVPTLTHLIEEMPYSHEDSGMPLDVMILVEGQIVIIEGDYSVLIVKDNFAAIGSGSDYALGVFYDSMLQGNLHQYPWKATGRAFEAAAYYAATVSGPYHMDLVPFPTDED